MFVRDCGAPAAEIRSHEGRDGSRTDQDPIRQPVDMPGETGQAGLFSKKTGRDDQTDQTYISPSALEMEV